MAASHQRFPNGYQRCTHPFLDCQSDDQETATKLTTAVRETEKVEGFRLSCVPLPTLSRSEPTESNQPRLVRVEFSLNLARRSRIAARKRLASPSYWNPITLSSA